MRKKSLITTFFISVSFFVGCKKNGTGGDADVNVYVEHHHVAINYPTVYVKFNAKDLPSDPTNNYDLKIIGTHENHVKVSGLRPGNYYIYSTGFDNTIMQNVKGGRAIKIKWTERKKDIDVDVPVTED